MIAFTPHRLSLSGPIFCTRRSERVYIAFARSKVWALRQQARAAGAALLAARQAGDADHAALLIGQDAGLIDSVIPAAEVIQRLVAEAERIIAGRLHPMLRA
jgi:NAD(P)H-dependent flavin oxidoreductase YrpB (nitropropane dioxygenase family)